MADELDREYQRVAPPPVGGETPPPLAGHSPGRGAEHGLRGGAGGAALPARDTRPDRATRFIETTRSGLSYSAVAPLLAERTLHLETALYQRSGLAARRNLCSAVRTARRDSGVIGAAPGAGYLQFDSTKRSACHGASRLLQTLPRDLKKTCGRGELLRAYGGEI